MKLVKEDMLKFDTHNWTRFKSFEKSLIVNLLRAQHFFLTWRAQLLSTEFWNIGWLWKFLMMKICTLRIIFAVGQGASRKLMSWVSYRVPKHFLDKGFPDCFKDGIVLCALTEKLVPGACPRFDLLDSEQPLRNLKLALHLVTKHIEIKPDVTADEILQAEKYSAKKLLFLVAQMKLASEKFKLSSANLKSERDYMSQTTFISEKCFARGMGLLLAVRGRKACFTILLDSTDNLDMVIEIRGPKNTACNKRIIKVYCMSRSDSSNFQDTLDGQEKEDVLSKRIPLMYRILGRKIIVSYTPLENGTHNMSIIWQGQHIMGSPYTITVDSSVDTPDICFVPQKRSYSRLRRSDRQYNDESIDYNDDKNLTNCHESTGTVVKKRVLRYIIKMDGNDVVIDGREDLCVAINALKLGQKNKSTISEDMVETCQQHEKRLYSENEFAVAKTNTDHSISTLENTNSPKHSNQVKTVQDSTLYENTKNAILNGGADMKNLSNGNEEPSYIDKLSYFQIIKNQHILMSDDTNEDYDLKQWIEPPKSSKNELTKLPDKINGCIVPGKSYEGIIMFDTENSNDNSNSCDTEFNAVKGSSPNITNNISTSNFPFLGENEEDSLLKDEKRKNTSDNVDFDSNMNSTHSSQYLNDDMNLFPVHKVEYEVLRDDDTDYLSVFNPMRRTSFTELHESDYLDDNTSTEIDPIPDTVSENFDNGTFDGLSENVYLKNEEGASEDDTLKFQEDSVSFNAYDGSKISSRANFAMFECDHSLAFWSETMEETSVDSLPYEECEFGTLSLPNVSEMWENKLRELESSSPIDDVSFQLDSLVDTDSINNTGYPENHSNVTGFNDMNFSDHSAGELYSFSQQSSQIIDEYGFMQPQENISRLNESFSQKKRPSWSDRDTLPCIPESSVEGYAESESFYNDKIRKELNDCKDKQLNEVNTTSKLKAELLIMNIPDIKFDENLSHAKCLEYPETNLSNCSISTQSKDMVKEISCSKDSTSFPGEFLKSTVSEDGFGNTFSFMNILPASQYKCRNFESETKYQTLSKFDEYSQQTPSTIEKSSSLLKPKSEIGSYILTYATPAVINESASSVSHEATSAIIYESSSTAIYQTTPSVIREATTDVMNEATIAVIPVAITEVNKEANPEVIQEASNAAIYKAIPEIFQEASSAVIYKATPAVIREETLEMIQEIDNTCKSDTIIDYDNALHITNNQDFNEPKSAQCLSVKKVIQLFQEEKEEPVDIWPLEIQKLPPFLKKCNKTGLAENVGKNPDLTETCNSPSSPAFEKRSSLDIPRSSIKDRVKLFEKGQRKVNYPLRNKNDTIEKCSSSQVAAKKNYWEKKMS